MHRKSPRSPLSRHRLCDSKLTYESLEERQLLTSTVTQLTSDAVVQVAHNLSGNGTSLSPDGKTLGYSNEGGRWNLLDIETGASRRGPLGGAEVFFHKNQALELVRQGSETVLRGFDDQQTLLTLPSILVPGATWTEWRIMPAGNNEIKDWIWLDQRNSTFQGLSLARANLLTGEMETRYVRELTGESNPLRADYRTHDTFWDGDKAFIFHRSSGPGFTASDFDSMFWEIAPDEVPISHGGWSHPTIVDGQHAYNHFNAAEGQVEIRFSGARESIVLPGWGVGGDISIRESPNHHYLLDGYLISSIEMTDSSGQLEQMGVRVYDPANNPIAFWPITHQGGNGFSNAQARPFLGWTADGLTAFWHSDADNIPGAVDLYSAPVQAASTTTGNSNADVPTEGLVSYWNLDNNVADQATAGAQSDNGILAGASFTSAGFDGAALEFDAVGDILELPSSLDINAQDVTQKSIALWFNPQNGTERQVIYSQGDTTAGMNIYLADGQLFAGAWNQLSGMFWTGTWASAANVDLNQWNHATLVYDSTNFIDGVKLYLNGAPATSGFALPLSSHGSAAVGSAPNGTRFGDDFFGFEESNDPSPYMGRVDELRIYDRSLAVEEVAALSAAPPAATLLNTVVPAVVPNTFTDLVAHWDFDGDVTDTGYGGTVPDDATLTDVDLVDGGWDVAVAQFDGQAVMTVPSSADINATAFAEKSIALWFYPQAAQLPDRQVVYQQGDSTAGLNIYLEGGTLHAGAWNDGAAWSGTWLSSSEIRNAEWNHVALVYDAANETSGLNLYVNGTRAESGSTASMASHASASFGQVTQGTRFLNPTGGVVNSEAVDAFVGFVDEARIYARAISEADVSLLAARVLDAPSPATAPTAPDETVAEAVLQLLSSTDIASQALRQQVMASWLQRSRLPPSLSN